MNVNEQMADGLRRNFGMLQMTLADFSDGDMLVRPVPAANHANWQLGHLLLAENGMMKTLGATMPELPGDLSAQYGNEAAKKDDAAAFLNKDQLLKLLGETREASARFAATLSPDQLAAPTPENMRRFAPTVADMAVMMSIHTTMHLGQIQVIRRKLGKPILF